MTDTGRRFLKCPATEEHARHMAHLKTLDKREDRAAYIEQVRAQEGPFMAKWLLDEFRTWWATKPQENTCQA